MSALLAKQALSLYDTSQAEAALRAALPDVQEIATLPTGAAVYGAAFDPADANEVAGAGQDGNAWIWNVKTGQRLGLRPQHSPGSLGAADAVAFNPAGTQVAVGYQYGDVTVFSTSGTLLKQVNIGQVINGIQFVGNTGELAIATRQNAVLWVPQDRSQPTHVLYKGQANTIAVDPINSLEFAVATNSGARILTLNNDLRAVNPAGVSLSTPSGLPVNDVEFSNDGSELAAADGDGVVRVYDAVGAKQIATLDAGRGVPEQVAIGPVDKLIAVGYSSGTTIVWDASTHMQLTRLSGPVNQPHSFEPDWLRTCGVTWLCFDNGHSCRV
jgi:WD40 repeat protein